MKYRIDITHDQRERLLTMLRHETEYEQHHHRPKKLYGPWADLLVVIEEALTVNDPGEEDPHHGRP